MCADSTTPSYLAFPGRLAQGMREKRDLRCYFYHPHCQLLRCRLGWEDCCWCWLLLDLLAISTRLSRVLCCRLGLTFAKKKFRLGKKWLYTSAFLLAGWPCWSGTGGAPAAAAERLSHITLRAGVSLFISAPLDESLLPYHKRHWCCYYNYQP